MNDVFVSYKAEDRKRVRPLVEALQAEGFSVWWDEQIGGGAARRQAIETELNAAKCVIVIWSSRSVGPDGTFVQDEATRAQQRHVYVPVLIDKVHLPLGFGETQALPLTGWHGKRDDPRYEAVLAAVRRNAGGRRRSTAKRLPEVRVDRRAMIAGGSVAAAAVAGVGVWALLKPGAAGAASSSVAVLPFQNLSGDPAQTYFSDGIAEEIRSALARVGGLQVAGSTSSEAVRNEDAQSVAKKLSVANILTGSVRQSASTIRISAELIDGRTGLDKWSQDYDRSPGDTIKIQTDIAQNVASALSATLGRAARTAVAVGGTSSPAAQDLFLKAKAQTKSDDSETSLRKAIGLYDSAITLDPKFALAYALKAEALADLNGYYTQSNGSFAPGYVQAASVARQAISLAPNLAAGHNVLAYVFESQQNVGAAAAEYERGHTFAGGDIDALLGYAGFLTLIGRTSEAKAIAKDAQARDPLNPTAFAVEGKALQIERRFEDSIAVYRKVMALAPNRLINRAQIGFMLGELGKNDEALANLRSLPPDHLFRLLGEAVINARAGNLAASDAALQRLRQLNGDAANYQYAEIYAQRGAKEQAFASLDRAWKFQDPGLPYMATDLWLLPLRSDPRFAAFLKKMNFPAA